MHRVLCCLFVVIAGCSSDTTSPSICAPGERSPCFLDGDALGARECNAQGTAYGACSAVTTVTGAGCSFLRDSCCPTLPAESAAGCQAFEATKDDNRCDGYLAGAQAVGSCGAGGAGGASSFPAYGPNCLGLIGECCATLPEKLAASCISRAFVGNEERCSSFLEVDAKGAGFCAGVDPLGDTCTFLAKGCCPTLPDGTRQRCEALASASDAAECLSYLGKMASVNRCPSVGGEPPPLAAACEALHKGCCSTLEGVIAYQCDLATLGSSSAECVSFEDELHDAGYCHGGGGSGGGGCGDTSSAVANCGYCGHVCGTENASPSCAGGVCSLACDLGFGDCDADPDNGCEVSLTADPTHCGGCQIFCGDQNGSATCINGACALSCDPGFDDCDGDPATGCETDLSKSTFHCGSCGNDCQGGVCSATSCGPAPFLVTAQLQVPSSLVTTAADLYLVGTQPLGGFAVQIKKNGGNVSCLLTGATPLGGVCGLGTFDGVVASEPDVFVTSASGVSRFSPPFGEMPLATDVPDAWALAVDTDSVFYTSRTVGGVFKVIRSGAFEQPQEITGGVGEAGGNLAVDSDHVYWTSLGGAVFRMGKGGEDRQQIASSQAFDTNHLTPQALAIDEAHLYWSTISGRIFRIEKDGSNLVLLVDAQSGPAGLFVEPGPAGSVYWANHTSGTVRRMAKDGTSVTTLAAGQKGPITVTVDDTFVYWATQVGEVWKIAK